MTSLTELGRQWNDAVESADPQPWNTLQFSAPGMTHEAEQTNPAIAELARRLNLTGQNLYNTWLAPAERLGRAATSGTLDVTNPETAGDAFGLAGTVTGARMPFAKVGELGSAGGKGVIAYHGSPHDFDRFDLSKIGTGEAGLDPNLPASQRQVGAYGPGLYFAENEGVARSYREATTRSSGNAALDWAARNPEVAQQARQQLESHSKSLGMRPPDDNLFSLMLNMTKEGHPPDAFSPEVSKQIKETWEKPPGKMYQVAIKADPEHFLDWDKPLSEQPPHIQKALAPLVKEAIEKEVVAGYHPDPMKATGEHAYGAAVSLEPSPQGGARTDSQAVTEKLRAAGIPGIKYLDQGSRDKAFRVDLSTSKGNYSSNHFSTMDQAKKYAADKEAEGFKTSVVDQGSRNYVVFDDKTIDILKKYGLLGLFGGGAASQIGPNTGQQ